MGHSYEQQRPMRHLYVYIDLWSWICKVKNSITEEDMGGGVWGEGVGSLPTD